MTAMELRESPRRKRAKVGTAALQRTKEKEVKSVPSKESKDTPRTLDKEKESSKAITKKEKTQVHSVGKDLYEKVPVCQEVFEIISKVGEGTFGKVYKARVRDFPWEMVALKHIIPTSDPSRIANELICLQELGGQNNVIDIKTTIRKEDHTVLVLPYFPHDKFQNYMHKMTIKETRDYFRNLFKALKWLHLHNIIHRDVKPSNFLYSQELKRYALVDFGLAMQVPRTTGPLSEKASPASLSSDRSKTAKKPRISSQPVKSQSVPQLSISVRQTDSATLSTHGLRKRKSDSQVYKKKLCPEEHERHEICTFCTSRCGQLASRAGTSGFRPPEVLMKLPSQTTAVDIWAAGVILLTILSGRYPFFKAPDDMIALAQIITVFGGKEVQRESLKFGKEVVCSPSPPAQDLKTLCERLRRVNCPLHDQSKNLTSTKGEKSDNLTRSKDNTKNRRVCKRTDKRTKGPIDADNDKFTSLDTDSDRTFSPNTSVNDKEPMCLCVPDDAYDLLKRCLRINPRDRITAEEALEHPFLATEEFVSLSSTIT